MNTVVTGSRLCSVNCLLSSLAAALWVKRSWGQEVVTFQQTATNI